MFLHAQIMKTKAYKTILLEKMFPISGCASMNCKTRVFSKVLRTMMTTVASKVGCCQKKFSPQLYTMNEWQKIGNCIIYTGGLWCVIFILLGTWEIYTQFLWKNIAAAKNLEITSLSLPYNWSAFNLFAHDVYVIKIN